MFRVFLYIISETYTDIYISFYFYVLFYVIFSNFPEWLRDSSN